MTIFNFGVYFLLLTFVDQFNSKTPWVSQNDDQFVMAQCGAMSILKIQLFSMNIESPI